MYNVLTPIQFFADTDGSPLDGGSIYFGTPGQNPETNPIQVYWDSAGTKPALQPIKTLSGYPVRSGTPTPVYAGSDFSMTVRSKSGKFIYGIQSSNLGSAPINLTELSSLGLQAPGGPAISAKGFWANVGAGANIWRLRDRLLVGGATVNDGNLPAIVSDWLEQERQYTTQNSQIAVLSTIGQIAFLSGSRTSDSNLAGSMGCIGGNFWGVNDNSVQIQTAYAAYFEARRKPGTGITHAIEMDIVNEGDVVPLTSYSMVPGNITPGLWIASGGEVAGANSASVAIGILNNGANFVKGIVFHSTSIVGTDGVNGAGVAVEFAKGHTMQWLTPSGVQGAAIGSDVSNGAKNQRLLFSDIGLLFRNSADLNLFRFGISSEHVNGFDFLPGATGVQPVLYANGTDTNVDLALQAKGAGTVDFRTPTVSGTAGASFGYVTLKFDGVPFKVQLFNM